MADLGTTILDFLRGRDPEAEKEYQKAVEALSGISTPTFENYTPEEYKAIQDLIAQQQGGTEYGKISEDPRLRDAQMQALQGLQDIYRQGGLTAEDKARQAMINQQAAQQERGQREAILQNMQARGIGGSGAELAANLAAQQSGANQRAMGGLQTAANAENRALQALLQGGQLGGQIRGQEYGMASDKARAQDIINQFNVANANQAAMQNWQNRQNIQNMNTGGRNQSFQYNQQNQQQSYINAMNKARELANQYGQSGDRKNQEARNLRDAFGNILSTAGNIGSMFYNPAGTVTQKLLSSTQNKNFKPYGNEYDYGYKTNTLES